jgi:ribosome-binding protein aMBF1 (putative translation factor)
MSILKRSSDQAGELSPFGNLAVILGNTIREQREIEGFSLQEVADRTHFHIKVLQLIEQGVWIPNDDEVMVLAKALNCHWIQLSMLAFAADQQRQPRFTGHRGF